ncbi:MAG: phosphoribosylformylglycinamidine cyclo-ligase, partial [Ktedonobacterales bacterium]
LALGTMNAEQVGAVVRGVAAGCRAVGCALIGGETAAMPGFYAAGEYDLAGCIVGVVERERIVTGAEIRPGDVIVGFPALGAHTNGYSLARHVFARSDLSAHVPELGRALGEELLQPHQSYLAAVQPLLRESLVTGMAHITGGGLVDNLPRVLPAGLGADLDAARWDVLPIFRMIQREGDIPWSEMRRVFNLGLGFLVCCRAEQSARALALAEPFGARAVGVIRERVEGEERVRVEGLA